MTDYFGRDAVTIAAPKGTRGLPFVGAEPDVVVSTAHGWDNYYPYDDPDNTGGRHFAKVATDGVLEIWVSTHGAAVVKVPQLVRRYSAHAWNTVEGASKSTDEPTPPISGPVSIPDVPLPGSSTVPRETLGDPLPD